MKKTFKYSVLSLFLIACGVFFIVYAISNLTNIQNQNNDSQEHSSSTKTHENLTLTKSYFNKSSSQIQFETILAQKKHQEIQALVQSINPKYKFETLEKFPNLTFGSTDGVNSNGYIFGQTFDNNGNQIPTIWNSEGKIVRRISNYCTETGIFNDMNSSNILTGMCFNSSTQASEGFVYDMNTDTYEILPNILANTSSAGYSINDDGQIVGTVNVSDARLSSKPIYWEKQNGSYVVYDITNMVYDSIDIIPNHIDISHIFNNGDILINAISEENRKYFVGYFSFTPNRSPRWSLSQQWTDTKPLLVYSANERYVQFNSYEFINGELFADSDIYVRTNGEEIKLDLLFNQTKFYEGLGYQNITVVSCNSLTPNYDIQCIIQQGTGENGTIRHATLNVESREFVDVSKLFEDGLVEFPSGYSFYPSTVEANGSILGQYRDENWNIYVGRIIPVVEPNTGEIITEKEEYEIGETFTANYIIKNGKKGSLFTLKVYNANATFPSDFYSFPEGECKLINQSENEQTWTCSLVLDRYELNIPITIDTKTSWFDHIELSLKSADSTIDINKKIKLVNGQYESEYLKIKQYISEKYNIPLYSIFLKTREYVEWSDGCLGVYKHDEMCTQVITPGYRLIFGTTENTTPQEFTIHSNLKMTYFREFITPPIEIKSKSSTSH